MPEQKKNLSRRDALKLLGAAAGATVLANLPAKWSKPSLASGVLPAHAQTSCSALVLEVLSGQFFAITESGPSPDLVTGTGGPGSMAVWYCQPGCLFFTFNLALPPSGSVRFTTITGSVVENYDAINGLGPRDIAVDLATGAIAIGLAGSDPSTGACSWPGGDTINEGVVESNRRIW